MAEKKRVEPSLDTKTIDRLRIVLQEQRASGASGYPCTVRQLVEKAEVAGLTASFVVKSPIIRRHLAIGFKKTASADAAARSFVVLVEDAPALLQSGALLVRLLELKRTASNQVASLAELGNLLYGSDQSSRFKKHWQAALDGGGLPEGVGSLRMSNTRKLFLLSDVQSSIADPLRVEAPEEPEDPIPILRVSEEPSVPLTERILAAFDRLDAARGHKNFVPLLELRGELPGIARGEFDAAVNELRRKWELTLDPAEGRHERVPAELLEAGIREGSSVLVYAARREG
jgi:hypothetical protein